MLYPAKTLKGYALHSRNGAIGSASEFYFDDNYWTVRYLVAETGGWLTGRKVLLSPYSLLSVDSEKKEIHVGLTKKQIEDSPGLESHTPVSRQFEDSYYEYYGWPTYWGGPYRVDRIAGVPTHTLPATANDSPNSKIGKSLGIPT